MYSSIKLNGNNRKNNLTTRLSSSRNPLYSVERNDATLVCTRIKVCEAHTWWSKGIWTIWTPTANTCWLALAGSCCTRILVADMVKGMLRCVTSRLNLTYSYPQLIMLLWAYVLSLLLYKACRQLPCLLLTLWVTKHREIAVMLEYGEMMTQQARLFSRART